MNTLLVWLFVVEPLLKKIRTLGVPRSRVLLYTALLLCATGLAFIVVDVAGQPPTLYDVLKCPNNAPPEALKKCYRALTLQLHPDKNPSKEAQDLFIQAK